MNYIEYKEALVETLSPFHATDWLRNRTESQLEELILSHNLKKDNMKLRYEIARSYRRRRKGKRK